MQSLEFLRWSVCPAPSLLVAAGMVDTELDDPPLETTAATFLVQLNCSTLA